MRPRHVTVTPDDIAAYLDYRCARARHDALTLGGGLALTAGIAVGITASLLNGPPLAGLICGVIPAALVLYNALRQTNPTRWRAELAKWHIPDRIPTGPMPLTTHDKGVSPPPDHKPTLPNGQTGATPQAPAAEDVGWALVGVARTARHRFVRLRFHHAWAIPLHALPPAHRTALLAELDAHRLPHHNQHQAPPEQQSAHQHAPPAHGSRAELHPRSPTPAPPRTPSSGQAQGRRADVRSPCCGESGFCLPEFGFRSPAVGFQSGRNRNHSCPIGLCSCRIGFRSHGDGFYCGEIGFLAAGNGYCFR